MKLSTQFLMDRHVHGGAAIDGEWKTGTPRAADLREPDSRPGRDGAAADRALPGHRDRRARGYRVRRGPRFLRPGAGTRRGGGPVQRARPRLGAVLSRPRRHCSRRCAPASSSWTPTSSRAGTSSTSTSACLPAASPPAASPSTSAGRTPRRASWTARTRTASRAGGAARRSCPGGRCWTGCGSCAMAGMGLEDYRLETVAQSVLGRGKRIDELPGREHDGGGRAAVRRGARKPLRVLPGGHAAGAGDPAEGGPAGSRACASRS